MVSVEGVSEVEVLYLDGVSASSYPREEIPVLTYGVSEESSSILHSTYAATLVVSISQLLMGRAPGCSTTAGAISL
jgi:hypothetical protein